LSRIESYLRNISIIAIFLFSFVLVPLKTIDNASDKIFENSIHTVEEWIPNEINAYVDDYPLRNKLLDTISNYVSNEEKVFLYCDLILEYSYKNDLNPWLVASVIAVESGFREKARSFAGARGLMQVMPNWRESSRTGNIYFSRWRTYRVNLYDPETNIRFGTHILKYYLDRYKNPLVALAAYNGSKGSTRYPDLVLAKFDSLIEEES